MKLNYFELLSPEPIQLPGTGGILSPKLRDIASIGYSTYQYYLTILLMDVKTFFTIIGLAENYDLLSDEEKTQLNIFELLLANHESATLLQNVLNFFIKEDVLYSPEQSCYMVMEDNNNIGIISKENYPQICDIIYQRNYIKSNREEDLSKAKNKKALEIMKKLQKGRSQKNSRTKTDQNMELGNIISAVANKSQSLNILNIWDLTVYQIWDCFSRLSNNSIYDIQSMSVAAWGDKDHHFDATTWFKRIDTGN